MSKMIQAVLWDMDGTLVDTEPAVRRTMQRAFCEAAGIELSAELLGSLLGRSEADFYAFTARHYRLSAAQLAAIRQQYDAEYLPMLAGLKGLPGAVEKAREFAANVPQALVTGSTRAQADVILAALRLRDAFRHVVACDHYIRGKPDPEPFLLAARLLGVKPEHCLAIEDSPAGVAAAKAAGMRVVGVHAGNNGRYNISSADWQIATLLELTWDGVNGV